MTKTIIAGFLICFSFSLLSTEAEWHAGSNRFIERAYSQFKPFNTTALEVGESRIDVYLSTGELSVSRETILEWVRNAAKALSGYYGHFPVPRLSLVLIVTERNGIGGGTTCGGKLSRVLIGHQTTEKEFQSDWVLTHEMFHTAFADLDDSHLWMEEGMAVYLEPIARARAGLLKPREVWRGMREGLPKGQPVSRDGGLDQTHTWGRTYWGGTLFWFLADIEIRKQTGNKHSVDDVMRAVLGEGGDGSVRWEIERVLDVGDKATQTHVLHDMYEKYARNSASVDLDELWKSLGVIDHGGEIQFDDSAPLAGIRKSILDASPPGR
jgi:predicted metalloprotease with PDZ domain